MSVNTRNDTQSTNNNSDFDKLSSNNLSQMDVTNSESSNSSIMEDDIEETEKLQKYEELLEHLKLKPFDYNAYVQLCQITDELGDLERLQYAYELFSGAYPLTSELWLKYLNVKIGLAQYDSERTLVCKIFSTALRDYYSLQIAHKLAEFLSAGEGGTDESLWTELVSVYGLNYFSGHHIFRLKRESIANNAKLSNSEKTLKTIEVFRWELRNPLETVEECWKKFHEYKNDNYGVLDWTSLDVNDDFHANFKAAMALSKSLSMYELRLTEANIESNSAKNTSRAHVYFEYLTFLENECGKREYQLSILHQLRQTIYERLVADYCLSPEYWLAYIDYIESRESIELPKTTFYCQTPLEITMRALRNCSAQELFIKAIQLMELASCNENKVREVLEQALAVGFENPESEVVIYLEYLTYLTRQCDPKSEKQISELRKNFDYAWNYLGRRWGVLADTNCEILQLWGTVEYELLNNPSAGRSLWTTVMDSSDNSSNSAMWVLLTKLEANHSIAEARNIFCRALNQANLDNVTTIATSWKLFERIHGTAVSRRTCYNTINSLQKRHLEEQKERIGDSSSASKQRKKELKRKAQQSGNDNIDKDVALKPKNMKFSENKTSESKVVNNKNKILEEKPEIDVTKDNIRLFLSNIDYHLSEQDVRDELSSYINITNIELKRSHTGKSRGFGFMEVASPSEVETAVRFDRHLINGRPIYISLVQREASQRKKFDYDKGKEMNKLFVKGLPGDCTQKELEQLFGVYGNLLDVRLVYHKSGNFKHIAFVEFKHEADAGKAALACNKIELRGTTLNVEISNPPARTAALDLNFNAPPSKTYIRRVAKPRLSLIPHVVRQKLKTAQSEAVTSNEEPKIIFKSNEDFRNLIKK